MAQNFIPRGNRTIDVQPLPDSMWERYNNRPSLLSTLATTYEYYNKLPRELKQKIAKLFEGKKEPSGREQIRALDPAATKPIPGFNPPSKEPVYGKSAADIELERERERQATYDRADRWTAEQETAEQERVRAQQRERELADQPETTGEAPVMGRPAEPISSGIRGPGANLGMGELTRGEKFADQIMDDQEKMRDLSEEEIVNLAIKKIMGQYE